VTKRAYVSSVRDANAAETRERLIAAAAKSLREESIARFSLDGVAKAAGVTRLTVYNQFHSRRGLLEAVFDDTATKGGLHKLGDAMKMEDALAALDRVIDIFCAFWGSDPAIAGLHEAIATDPEFGEALLARNERRRKLLVALVDRLATDASPKAQRDAVDLLFALTSYSTFAMLCRARKAQDVCRIVQVACHAAIKSLTNAPL
jgi:AcrR family transcriptional regulator